MAFLSHFFSALRPIISHFLAATPLGVGLLGTIACQSPTTLTDPITTSQPSSIVSESSLQAAPEPKHLEPSKPVGETAGRLARADNEETVKESVKESVGEGGAEAPCGAEIPDGMVCIPAQTFTRGIDRDPHHCDMYQQPRDGHSASTPAAQIALDSYLFDLYEVTNSDFDSCRRAGKCRVEAGPKYSDFSGAKQPITGVSWYDAQDYCRFVGKRLPTEAEWEHVARGPHSDTYPWGNDPPDCTKTVIKDSKGRSCGKKKRRGTKPETGRVMDVGSRPPGHFGVYDMAGNTQEWVADWWTRDYTACGNYCLGRNPKGPCQGMEPCKGYKYRVVKGGSWYWDGSHTTGYHRRRHIPSNNPYHHFGFRCAKTPPT